MAGSATSAEMMQLLEKVATRQCATAAAANRVAILDFIVSGR